MLRCRLEYGGAKNTFHPTDDKGNLGIERC